MQLCLYLDLYDQQNSTDATTILFMAIKKQKKSQGFQSGD